MTSCQPLPLGFIISILSNAEISVQAILKRNKTLFKIWNSLAIISFSKNLKNDFNILKAILKLVTHLSKIV